MLMVVVGDHHVAICKPLCYEIIMSDRDVASSLEWHVPEGFSLQPFRSFHTLTACLWLQCRRPFIVSHIAGVILVFVPVCLYICTQSQPSPLVKPWLCLYHDNFLFNFVNKHTQKFTGENALRKF
ncbi:hypothetical protein HPG69_011226 [Diceros bicornis minor]|uniref:Uncharacterized protein n=1 Tax=Diceros bicornis minor TaxID=77932 RepID=A0A7J7EYX6_DICBM|nr:hypothetical protein HPG69_011226 [Diceros bicornis minor]